MSSPTFDETRAALPQYNEAQLTALVNDCHKILVTRCVQRRADDAAAFNAAFRAPEEQQGEVQE
jgi:hypothetical protein